MLYLYVHDPECRGYREYGLADVQVPSIAFFLSALSKLWVHQWFDLRLNFSIELDIAAMVLAVARYTSCVVCSRHSFAACFASTTVPNPKPGLEPALSPLVPSRCPSPVHSSLMGSAWDSVCRMQVGRCRGMVHSRSETRSHHPFATHT